MACNDPHCEFALYQLTKANCIFVLGAIWATSSRARGTKIITKKVGNSVDLISRFTYIYRSCRLKNPYKHTRVFYVNTEINTEFESCIETLSTYSALYLLSYLLALKNSTIK